jgi:hypothetical protein
VAPVARLARLEVIRWETQFYQAYSTFQAQIPRTMGYAALVMAPPAWLSTITGVSNQLISGSEP